MSSIRLHLIVDTFTRYLGYIQGRTRKTNFERRRSIFIDYFFFRNVFNSTYQNFDRNFDSKSDPPFTTLFRLLVHELRVIKLRSLYFIPTGRRYTSHLLNGPSTKLFNKNPGTVHKTCVIVKAPSSKTTVSCPSNVRRCDSLFAHLSSMTNRVRHRMRIVVTAFL